MLAFPGLLSSITVLPQYVHLVYKLYLFHVIFTIGHGYCVGTLRQQFRQVTNECVIFPAGVGVDSQKTWLTGSSV